MSVSINPVPADSSTGIVWGRATMADLATTTGIGSSRACMVADYNGMLCWLDIAPDCQSQNKLFADFPKAEFHRDDGRAQSLLDDVLRCWQAGGDELRLAVTGTSFQLQVWHALTDICHGSTATYGELAKRIARPGAARAVGSAAAANKIALLIPCHRLVPAAGGSGAYRWGAALKRTLLDAEHSTAKNSIYGLIGTNKVISARLS